MKLNEENQGRIATFVTLIEQNNYHEMEENIVPSLLVHNETYFTTQPCMVQII